MTWRASRDHSGLIVCWSIQACCFSDRISVYGRAAKTYNYNDGVDPARVARLQEINRRFYTEHGADFAETRRRIQPGVRGLLRSWRPQDTILDLGCGSGALAQTLSLQGHRGCYLGLDYSRVAVMRASEGQYEFPARFVEVDFLPAEQLGTIIESNCGEQAAEGWAVVAAFAVLHHIPGRSLRLGLLGQARRWTRPDGCLVLSTWRFSSNSRMRSRIVPWSTAGVDENDVDPGDYLVEWRRGGTGVRYVHEFDERELAGLAQATGFRVEESFLSDGADRHSGLYQIWRPA